MGPCGDGLMVYTIPVIYGGFGDGLLGLPHDPALKLMQWFCHTFSTQCHWSMGEFHSNSPSLAMKTEWSRPRQIYLSRKGQWLTSNTMLPPDQQKNPPEYPASSKLRLMSILMWVVECKMLLKSTWITWITWISCYQSTGILQKRVALPQIHWNNGPTVCGSHKVIPRTRQQRQEAVA